MTRTLRIVLALAALGVTVNAWAQRAMPSLPVTMVGRAVQVQERIEVRRDQGPVTLHWHIDPQSDFVFAPEGIRIDGQIVRGGLRPTQQIHSCRGGPRHVVCNNDNSVRGEFKYTVRLLDRNQALVEKDPVIVNR